MYKIRLYSSDGTLKRSFGVHSPYRFEKRIRSLIKKGASLIERSNKIAILQIESPQ